VLAEIDQPVTIIGFFGADDYRRGEYEELIDLYLYENDQLAYSVIDPDREPIKAQQYDPIPYGGLLFQAGDRIEKVYTPGEQEITSALLKVVSEEKKTIYFLTGHQERDIQRYELDGYSTVADALRDQNYIVESLNLAITTTVPSDATVVVIAGPQVALLEEEVTQLQSYLIKGGKALIMQDPLYDDTGLNDLLASWQVQFGEGVVIDIPSSMMIGPAAPAVNRYGFGQITKDMNGLMTFYPLASPIEQVGQDPTGATTFTPLVETSPDSWAEQDVESEEVQFDEDIDVPGPLTLMASIEAPPALGSEEAAANPDLKTRLVLVGDSDFASNELATSVGNGVIFLNTVNWLTEEETLIAIGPKGSQPRTVFLSAVQSTGIAFVSVVLIPFTLLIAGIVVWWQRR
jgi:ABC-type uncharacterized transport system involved in gliding motility auxiliary subunit